MSLFADGVIVCVKHQNISRQVNRITGEVRRMSGEKIQKLITFLYIGNN